MGSYRNPVVRGHAPDPSVVRVDADFYLANSSFGMLPGIPIRHSTDLIHWTLIGHAVSRPAQYRRDGRPGPVELFAPTLRYHDGVFYAACTNAHEGQGNFYVTTDDPAGEWSDAIWVDDVAFDPSLFRDEDGTWYYTRRSLEFGRDDGNLGPIVQAEIDIETGAIGTMLPVTPAAGGFVTNDIEGPHVFARHGWYYLTAAEGSSAGKGHMQTIARSRSPWGPFEPAPHNPILTHRNRVGHPVQNLGHVDFFDDADGNWWAVALGTRHAPLSQHHNIGRETFLIPVSWEENWPVVGRNGTTELRVDDVPLPDEGPAVVRPDTLGNRGWVTIGQPLDGLALLHGDTVRVPAADALWDRSERRGALLIAQSADDQLFRATVADVDAADAAGVAVYADRRHAYAATVSGRGENRVITVRKQVDDLVDERVVGFPGDGELDLEIEARPDAYTFRASTGSERVELGSASARLLSAEAVEWFVAVHFALLALDTASDSYVDFRGASLLDLEPRPVRPIPPFAADL